VFYSNYTTCQSESLASTAACFRCCWGTCASLSCRADGRLSSLRSRAPVKKLGTRLPNLVVTRWRETSMTSHVLWHKCTTAVSIQQQLTVNCQVSHYAWVKKKLRTFPAWDSKTAAPIVMIAKKTRVILESPTQWFYWVRGIMSFFSDKPVFCKKSQPDGFQPCLL